MKVITDRERHMLLSSGHREESIRSLTHTFRIAPDTFWPDQNQFYELRGLQEAGIIREEYSDERFWNYTIREDGNIPEWILKLVRQKVEAELTAVPMFI